MKEDLKLVVAGGVIVAIALLIFVSYRSIVGADDNTRNELERLERSLEQ